MQAKLEEKQKDKVTLYISPEVHRQLKIRAALENEAMSTLAERALGFYLAHADLVEERMGQAYRLYACPACTTPLVLREGELTGLPETSAVLLDEEPPRPTLGTHHDTPVLSSCY
ncbi:hypothetical protein [Anthocerotibacter panamensis]|uniref:hypothetical protein n=1 Tax=Anthocerotibacter panamensis TaxID=2857077 RepID=UPI001C401BC0|nr:hypothetical protein [Anthocerotibacter panamensis]